MQSWSKVLFIPDLTEDNVGDFVFATAANRHFFKHLQSTVSTIQRHKPNYKIYVYDLGLTDVQLIKVRMQREMP